MGFYELENCSYKVSLYLVAAPSWIPPTGHPDIVLEIKQPQDVLVRLFKNVHS